MENFQKIFSYYSAEETREIAQMPNYQEFIAELIAVFRKAFDGNGTVDAVDRSTYLTYANSYNGNDFWLSYGKDDNQFYVLLRKQEGRIGYEIFVPYIGRPFLQTFDIQEVINFVKTIKNPGGNYIANRLSEGLSIFD